MFNPNQNWVLPLNIDPNQPLLTYVYSYYFAVTTLMTVGYGDITPKNYVEVLVVSMVEIFGTRFLIKALLCTAT